MSKIEINASVEVIDRATEPLRLTQEIGTILGPDGEQIAVLTSFPGPLEFILRGDKLVGTIKITPLLQEAAIHVAKANYKES